MTPNTRTLKGQSYCSQRWANPAWPKGSKSRGFSTSLYSNNDFTLTKNFGLTLGFWAATKSKSASYTSNARYYVDLGGRLSLFKGKMDVSLNWSNMLYNHNKITVKGDGWTIKRRDKSPNSRIQLSLAWNFSAGSKIQNKTLPSVSRSTRQVPTF